MTFNIHDVHLTEIHILFKRLVLISMPYIPIRDDALCDLTDEDEEQDKGE